MDTKLRDEIIQMHAQLCNGLADPNRILILYTLNERSYNVNELAGTLGLPQPTVSRHLKILRERNMVIAERDGQSVSYSVADQKIIQALDLLRTVMTTSLESKASLVRNFNFDTPGD